MIIFIMFFFIFAMIHTDCIEGSNRNSLKQSILLCLCTLSYSFSLRFMLYTVFFALTAYCLIVFGDQRSQISLKKRNSLRDYSNQPQEDSRFIDMRYHNGFSSHQNRIVLRNCNLFYKKIHAVLIDVLALPLRDANQIYGSIERLKLLVLRNRSFLQDKLVEARSFFPNRDHHIGTALDGACN